MEYKFSERVKSLKPSAIREMLKNSSDPNYIPFAAGNPSEEAFPLEEIKEISARILCENPITALQYSVTEGYKPLIEYLKTFMKEKYNIGNEDDELIITSGAQQVMNLATKSLCNEGDTIICEAPSFIGSLNSFRSYKVNLCGVPLENDGINLTILENSLRNNLNVKFIYTIPNFQNPSGVTMSLEKRKAIYSLAKKYNVLILEDNPYGDLRFTGENLPSIKSFDTDGRVIYAGSFSKILSPGLRVGWCVANKNLTPRMVVCKQTEDVHTNIFAQMIAYEFLTKYDFNKHIERLQEIYRKRATFAMDLIDKYLVPYGIKYNRVEGGLFILCDIPKTITAIDFCKKAMEKNVGIVPGNNFLVNAEDTCYDFRLNYSTPSYEQLEKGIKLLGETAKEVL